jgi:hypothetical protein
MYEKKEDAISAASSLLSIFPMPGVDATDIVKLASITRDPCKPTLSWPSQILTLDPAWNICEPPVTALFDPPYTLTSGNGLSAFSPTPPATIPTAKPVTPKPTTSNMPTPTSPDPEVGTNDPKPTSSIVVSATLPTAEVSTVRIVTVDSSTFSISLHIPVTDPGIDNSEPFPTPSSPAASDPTQPELTETSPADQPSTGQPSATASPPAVISFDSSAIIAGPSLNFVVGSQTLTPGGAITVSGTTVALATDGSALVVNGITETIAIETPPAIEELIISSQTLRPGSDAITVSGTVISLPPGASNILIGTKTDDLGAFISQTVTASVANIGGIVMTLGGYVVHTSIPVLQPYPQGTGSDNHSNGTVPFLGRARRTIGERIIWTSALTPVVGLLGLYWL